MNMGKIDKGLTRASHIAQIVLVAVAVFGYFATVRPVYQKELLAEEVAKKQELLNELNNHVIEAKEKLRLTIIKDFVFVSGAKCTGLFDPVPMTPLGVDRESLPPKPARTLASMSECAKSTFTSSRPLSQLDDFERQELYSLLERSLSSEEAIKSVANSSTPEEGFREVLSNINWRGAND